MRAIYTVLLLLIANVFMTLAWYGHLKWGQAPLLKKYGLIALILSSWGLAFFEYMFQVPANKLGYAGNGGTFSLVELKVLQEVITLFIFTLFGIFFFKESLRLNHLYAFLCLIGAVYFAFRK